MSGLAFLSELQTINAEIAGNHGGFRRDEVFCVDRSGREVGFYKPEDVDPAMQDLMAVFANEYMAATDKGPLALILAKFYYSLIAIHPFSDGNRRTGFAFLKARAGEKGWSLQNIELLQKFLFEGNVQEEMKKLTALFQHMLQPI